MTPEEARKAFAMYPHDGRKLVKIRFATLAILVEHALIPNEIRAELVERVIGQLTP